MWIFSGTFPKPSLAEFYNDKYSVKARSQKGMCLDRPLKTGRHFPFSKNCVSLKTERAFCFSVIELKGHLSFQNHVATAVCLCFSSRTSDRASGSDR